MEHKKICEVGKQWIGELVALSATQDILPLLTPNNIQIGEQGIELKNKNAQGLGLYLYSGYSAPEIYQGQPSAASSVYFAGAVLYALYTGATPPDAPARVQANTLLLAQTDPLAAVINRATMPYSAQRIGSLQQLWQELHAAELSIAPMPPAAVPVPPQEQQPPVVSQPAQETEVQAVEPVAEEKPVEEAPTAEQTPVVQVPPEKEESAKAEEPASQELTPPQKTDAEPVVAAMESPKEEEKPAVAPTEEPSSPEVGFAALGPVSAAASAPANSTQDALKTEPATMNTAPTAAFGQPAAASYAQGQQPAAQNNVPFGYGAVQPGVQPSQATPAKPKKKVSKKAILIAAAVVVVLAIAAVVYTLVQGNRIDNAFAENDYATVVSAADMTPWLKNGKQQQYDYSRAYLLMEEGKTEESLEIFESLGDFENSPKMVQSLKYDLAGQMMEQGRLQEALTMYKQIHSYKDSAEIAQKLETYMGADDINDPLSRYDVYVSLGDFLDSTEKAAGLAGEIYEEGLSLYAQQDFVNARDYFEAVGGYENASLYLEACDIYLNASEYQRLNTSYVSRLRELSADIDVSSIMVSDKFLMCWLNGEWKSSDGGGDFYMNVFSGYDFSTLPFTGIFYFTNAGMYREPSGAPTATFTYVSFDEMTLTTADGTVYTFTRTS